jgi:uncharacterized delta-60 repeat protein
MRSLALQGDGKIVLLDGPSSASMPSQFVRLERFDAAGQRDTTFGIDGTVQVDANDFGVSSIAMRGIDHTVQADGKIVVVGGIGSEFLVFRLNPDGSIDTNFGFGGIASLAINGTATAVEIQNDGKIVVGGNDGDFVVARYLSDGLIDTSFGGFGVVQVEIGGDRRAFVEDIAVEDNGRVVLAGYRQLICDALGLPFYEMCPTRFALARVLEDGALDSAFDSDGKVLSDFGYDRNIARAIALRDDRMYVVGAIGQTRNAGGDRDHFFGIARYVVWGQIGIGVIRQYLTSVECTDNVAVANTLGLCGASIDYPDPVLGDPGYFECSPNAGSFFDVGTTQASCTSTVGDGTQNQQRQATCTFDVSVSDVESPTATCPVVTVPTAEGQCSAMPAIPVSAVDNCGVAPPAISPPSESVFALGTTPYTATVTDASGNSFTCSSTVTVVDETAPEIQCNTEGVDVRPGVPVSFQATATDNCSVASASVTSFDCWTVNQAGKRVDKTKKCTVSIDGANVNIIEPSGVETIIGWEVEAEDGSGNRQTASCQVTSQNPSALE